MDFNTVIASQPIVIDNGSGILKAGFAGENAPKCIFGNYVGRPKHTRVMAGALEGDCFIGPKAQEYRGLLALKYPMEHGIVTDWSDMEKIWQYIYSSDQLRSEPSEHPVLLTEAPLNPQTNREKAAEIFFETFNVPALYIQIQAVLSLYSSGRTTGVVLDSGDGVTHVVPIFEGFAVEHGIQRIDIAGRDVTRYLRLLLRKEGHIFSKTSEFEIVREIKEQKCKLYSTPLKDDSVTTESTTKVIYPLPDGSKIEIGAAHYRAPEILFRPELIGEECDGVAHCLSNAIFKCDVDLRKKLYENIVLSGGSTMFQGFGDRLLTEMRRLGPKDAKIRILAPQERIYSTWIGGSILASLDTFRKIWVTKQQYESIGKGIITRKTFSISEHFLFAFLSLLSHMDEKINISKENSPTLLNHQFDYSDMHSMSLDELKNLRRKVESKVQNLQGELSDLAFHNYRTYVDVSTTAEYCREKFSQMDTLMRQSSSSFPNLEEQIDQFKNQSTQLLNEFKLLSDVESTNFLIWEIIRLPKLMEKCIRAGHFDQAYSITNFALSIKQSKLVQYPLFKNVVDYLLEARHSLLDELFNKFSGPLNLAHSIQIINNIRKIPYISKTQLRISILQYRDIYLEKKVSSIMSEPDFILRVIEVYRECMYDTIILYLAVFPDTDTQQRFVNEDTRWERWTGSSQNYLLQCWAQKNIERLLSYVQCCEYKSLLDIEMMVSKLMSCAFSFGRMGLDFRPLVHCKFSQMVLNIFQNKIEAATKSFTSNEKIDLIDDGIFETTQSELKKEISRVDLSAPLELCIWDDLCIFGNSIIDALNEIRHSIYINSIRRVFNILHFSFQNIFAWMDSFLSNQENIFIVKKATFLLIKQFLPFINNCFFSCFPYEQCAKKYFTIGNCSLNEYKNTFNLMNLNIFGLCKNESLFFEMIKEFDLKENEEQNILIEEESINTKNLENEEIVKNEEEEKKEENLQVE